MPQNMPKLLHHKPFLALLLSCSVLLSLFAGVNSASAATVTGADWNPAANLTTSGQTSVPLTTGKAQGSGLWGYVGDLKTNSGTGSSVYSYGIAISPVDGSVWVTDSAKVVYTSSTAMCSLLNGTMVSSGACLIGVSTLIKYPLNTSADWSTGQYSANGTYSASIPAGNNGGIGANYATRANALTTTGSSGTAGNFGGARGVTVDSTGKIWVSDPDVAVNSAAAANRRYIRTFNADTTESTPSLGNTSLGWADKYQDGYFDYPVGIAQLKNGNIMTMSQTAQLLKEYTTDGTFVRNIFLNQPANTAYTNDKGIRYPYAIAVDPADGTVLVGYTDQGNGNSSIVQRIDLNNCTVSANYNQCTVLNTIGIGQLANGNGNDSTSPGVTFAIAVDPVTENIYVAQRSGQMYAFKQDGTYLGRVGAYGSGTANGQITSVRGIAFDARGYMYVTTSEGTANTRVEIFARTANAVTNLVQSCTSENSLTLSWNAPDTTDASVIEGNTTAGVNGIVPVKDYVVEESTNGGATWNVVSQAASTDTSRTISSLDPSQTYSFRVSAWNEAGNSDAVTLSDVSLSDCQPGSFVIAKTVDGSTRVPADRMYTFEYSTDNGVTWTNINPITAGETTTAVSLPVNTRVLVREQPVSSAESYTLSSTSFAGTHVTNTGGMAEFTVESNTETTVQATNTYADINGSLTITHQLVDPNNLAPSDLEYTGTWSYPAASDGSYPAASGVWTLTANGSTTITKLPAGATVSITETMPHPISGATWTSTVGDPVTIGADATSNITVTNTLTADEITPPTTTTPEQQPPTLPETGISDVMKITLLTVALITVGITLRIRMRGSTGE